MSTAASWSLQRDTLAVEALRQSGQLRLKVRGESMLPSIWPGDIVRIEAASLGTVGRGDIVLAYRDGRFFLHRLLAMTGCGFVARGDSMPAPDPAYSAENLVGKLAGVERDGKLPRAVRLRLLSRFVGLIFCHSDLARRAGLRLHQRFVSKGADESRLWNLTSDVCAGRK